MQPHISAFPSKFTYHGRMTNDKAVKKLMLSSYFLGEFVRVPTTQEHMAS